MPFWDEKHECCSRDELIQIQLERVQSVLNRVYKNVSFYKNLFDNHKIVPEDVSSLEQFQKLPFTTLNDLQNNYPYGLFAVPLREVVRIHTATETVDKPTVIGYTLRDIRNWSNLVARFLTSVGVSKEDVIQVSFHYGLYTGAFGLHHGAELIGASVIPASNEHSDRQVRIMQDYRSSVLVSTPSFALVLADACEKHGINLKTSMLKKGIFGGEIWSEETRHIIEERLFIDAYDNYGVSVLMGPGIAAECPAKNGLHIYEDHVLAEIIDPDTLTPLPYGSTGELVLTTLTREAFPIIRYRTGDITTLDNKPCTCGRTLARMRRIEKRTDNIIIIKGINIVPEQIEKTILSIEGCEPLYQIIAKRQDFRDSLIVKVAVSEMMFFDEIKKQTLLLEKIQRALHQKLKVKVEVKLSEKKSLGQDILEKGKIIDERKL